MELTVPGEAHYVHASVYRYTASAVGNIRQQFDESARSHHIDLSPVGLHYDAEHDVFTLTCPSAHGFFLDQLLGQVIARYAAQEISAADREEVPRLFFLSFLLDFTDLSQRSSNVKRIKRSGFEEVLDLQALDDGVDDHACEPIATHDGPTGSAPCVHVVNTSSSGKIKLLHFRELPSALQKHASASSRHSDPSPYDPNALTLCAVRWDDGSQKHVYGSSTGKPLPKSDPGLFAAELRSAWWGLLPLSLFESAEVDSTGPAPEQVSAPGLEHVRDPEAGAATQLEPGNTSDQQWEFIGKKPTVEQWLAGMGETRQVEPNLAPEAARDAIKFSASEVVQQPPTGRVRVPKGLSIAALRGVGDEEEYNHRNEHRTEAQVKMHFAALTGNPGRSGHESEESESEPASDSSSHSGHNTAFDDLFRPSVDVSKPVPAALHAGEQRMPGSWPPETGMLQPRAGKTTGADGEKSDSDSDDSSNMRGRAPVGFQDLLSVVKRIGRDASLQKKLPSMAVSTPDTVTQGKEEQNDHCQQPSNPTQAPSSERLAYATSAQLDDGTFPSYGAQFAKVDTMGLMGNASSQAKWEMENISPMIQRDREASGADSLHRVTTSGSRPMSVSTGRNPQHLPSRATSDTIRSTAKSSTTPSTYEETVLGGPESWATKVVPNAPFPRQAPSLVDDRISTPSGRPPLAIRPSSGSSRPAGLTSGASGAGRAASLISGTVQAVQAKLGNLVDVSETSVGQAQSRVSHRPLHDSTRPPKPTLTPQTISLVQHIEADFYDGGHIIERLRSVSPKAAGEVRRTMNQKASKKGKSSDKRKPGFKAMLPMPSPPRVVKKTPAIEREVASAAAISPAQPGQSIPEVPLRTFAKLLLSSISQDRLASSQVLVNFGKIGLFCPADKPSGEAKSLPLKALRAPDMEEELQQNHPFTIFSPQTPMIAEEVCHLMNMPGLLGSNIHDETRQDMLVRYEYAVRLKDHRETRWLVELVEEKPGDFSAVARDAGDCTMFVHCPEHVWDAKVEVHQHLPPSSKRLSEAWLDEAVKSYARSVKLAREPNGQTSVTGAMPCTADGRSPVAEIEAFQLKVSFSRHVSPALPPELLAAAPEFSRPSIRWTISHSWDLEMPTGPPNPDGSWKAHTTADQSRSRWDATMLVTDFDTRQDSAGQAALAAQVSRLEWLARAVVANMDCIGFGVDFGGEDGGPGGGETRDAHGAERPRRGGKDKGKRKARAAKELPFW